MKRAFVLLCILFFAPVVNAQNRFFHSLQIFERRSDSTISATDAYLPKTCIPLSSNTSSYTIVIIPDLYDDSQSALDDAKKLVKSMSTTNIPTEVLSKIGFVFYNEVATAPYSTTRGDGKQSTHTVWNRLRAEEVKTRCNGNEYILLIKWSYPSGTAFWTGGAAISNAAIAVAPHELGHSVAKLDDEYVYKTAQGDQAFSPPRAIPGPNCSLEQSCREWKEKFSDITCTAGCHYVNWYRPTVESIMRNPYKSREFSAPALQTWVEWGEKR